MKYCLIFGARLKHVRLYRPKGIWSFGGSRLGQSKLQEFGRGSNPPNNFYRKVGTFSILYVAALVMTALQSLGSTLNHHFPISKKVLLKIGGVAACLLSGVLQAKVRMLQGLRSPQPNFVVGFGRHHHTELGANKKICSPVSIGPLVSSCFCRQQSFQVVGQRVVRQILVVRFPDVSLQLSSTPWWCVVGDTTPCHASFRALQGNFFECFCVHFRGVAMICDDV